MLIIHHSQLDSILCAELRRIDPRVVYWPFGIYTQQDLDRVNQWWISFSSSSSGLIFVMRYSDSIQVRYWD